MYGELNMNTGHKKRDNKDQVPTFDEIRQILREVAENLKKAELQREKDRKERERERMEREKDRREREDRKREKEEKERDRKKREKEREKREKEREEREREKEKREREREEREREKEKREREREKREKEREKREKEREEREREKEKRAKEREEREKEREKRAKEREEREKEREKEEREMEERERMKREKEREKTEKIMRNSFLRMDRMDRRREEADRKFERRMNKLDGDWKNDWGEFVEVLISGGLTRAFKRNKIHIDRVFKNQCYHLRNGNQKREWEFDLVAMNGKEVFIVETKRTMTIEKIDHFIKQLTSFLKIRNEFPDMKVYATIAYLRSPDEQKILQYAKELGLLVIHATANSPDVVSICKHSKPYYSPLDK